MEATLNIDDLQKLQRAFYVSFKAVKSLVIETQFSFVPKIEFTSTCPNGRFFCQIFIHAKMQRERENILSVVVELENEPIAT